MALIHQLICAGGFASAENLHFQNYDDTEVMRRIMLILLLLMMMTIVTSDDITLHYITLHSYDIKLHYEVGKRHYLHKEELLAVDPNSMYFLPKQSLNVFVFAEPKRGHI